MDDDRLGGVGFPLGSVEGFLLGTGVVRGVRDGVGVVCISEKFISLDLFVLCGGMKR